MPNEFGSNQTARRAFTRIPVHIAAEVTPDEGETLTTTVHDLSFNGVSVELRGAPMARGTEAEITLLLESGSDEIRLPGHGQVVWSSPEVTAFSFSALDGDVYEHFERLVLLNAPDPEKLESELHDHEDEQPPLRKPQHD